MPKTLEIDLKEYSDEYSGKVGMRKLTFGERLELEKESKGKSDLETTMLTVRKMLTAAPFEISDKGLKEQDEDLILWLGLRTQDLYPCLTQELERRKRSTA
jgi:hypothetical protein